MKAQRGIGALMFVLFATAYAKFQIAGLVSLAAFGLLLFIESVAVIGDKND